MRSISFPIFLVVVAATASACGQASDPVSAIGDPQAAVVLQSPVDTNLSVTQFLPYTASHPSFEWSVASTVGGSAPVAVVPASGVVTEVDATANAASVTIFHNSRVTSKISRLASVSLRVGDVVKAGETAGTLAANTAQNLQLTVYQDKATICPLSFLNDLARGFVQQFSVNQFPCQK